MRFAICDMRFEILYHDARIMYHEFHASTSLGDRISTSLGDRISSSLGEREGIRSVDCLLY